MAELRRQPCFCYAGLLCLQREVPTTQWKIPTTIVHSQDANERIAILLTVPAPVSIFRRYGRRFPLLEEIWLDDFALAESEPVGPYEQEHL